MTAAHTHEKENEMFFLFHRCAARDLGLFQNCSRNVPRNKRNNPGTSGTSLCFPPRSVATTAVWRGRNKRNIATSAAEPSAPPPSGRSRLAEGNARLCGFVAGAEAYSFIRTPEYPAAAVLLEVRHG
jgi:hypothetical protein